MGINHVHKDLIMSFINLMGNDRWTEKDIVNRTEAMVRGVISAEDEVILNRKITGVILGQWVMSSEDMALQLRFSEILAQAHQEGIDARNDMQLLEQVFLLESGEILQEDASQDVIDLYNLRQVPNETNTEQPSTQGE